jgi:hypothetical protein
VGFVGDRAAVACFLRVLRLLLPVSFSHLLHAGFLFGRFAPLKLEVICSCETSVHIRTIRRYTAEGDIVRSSSCCTRIVCWCSQKQRSDQLTLRKAPAVLQQLQRFQTFPKLLRVITHVTYLGTFPMSPSLFCSLRLLKLKKRTHNV